MIKQKTNSANILQSLSELYRLSDILDLTNTEKDFIKRCYEHYKNGYSLNITQFLTILEIDKKTKDAK